MGTEIERKFLLISDAWRAQVGCTQRIMQGYLTTNTADAKCSVRVRITGVDGWLSIKSASPGILRQEYEYAIPVADAERMLREFCGSVIEKQRHYVRVDRCTYEVDEFFGDNSGLIVAELELEAVDQLFERPDWLGREVSNETRYYNARLVHHPYTRWTSEERAG